MTIPKLSIIMLIYNGEKYIREAIDSVINQTFKDFELILINDGSLDHSLQVISTYTDNRIRIINLEENKGIPYCRNMGLNEARGEFLAWTDCDDVNHLTRFEKQIEFLQNNPDFGGCGTWISRFKNNTTYFTSKAQSDPELIKASLLFTPAAIPNATVMLRMEDIRKYNITYNTQLPIGEDFDFIFKCSKVMKFTNIQESLYKYRDSENSIMNNFNGFQEKSFDVNKIIYDQILKEFDLKLTADDYLSHYLICSDILYDTFDKYAACYLWMKHIKDVNTIKKIYQPEVLDKVLADRFFFISKKASKFGLKTLFYFVEKSKLNNWFLDKKNLAKLSVRCLLKHDKFEFKLR